MAVKAGIARGDITPPEDEKVLGYNIRSVKGIESDITVTCLALESGDTKYLIISADIIWISEGFNTAVKGAVTEATGIVPESVILAAIHTHCGPLVWEWKENTPGEEYKEKVISTIAETAKTACMKMQPCTVGWGTGEVDISHNRRVIKEDGMCENVWTDTEREHTGPVDKELRTVCFKDYNDNLMACLVNFSCHPVTMGPKNHRVSADFPGYTRQLLEEKLPGTLVLYTNGTAGNVNPYDCITNDFGVARKAGETVGNKVMDIVLALAFSDDAEIKNTISEIVVKPHDNADPEHLKQLTLKDGCITGPMHLLKIGGLLFVSLPGEPTVEIGNMIREESDAELVIPVGYANGSIGYLPTREMISQGGLEVKRCPSNDVEMPIMDAFKSGLKKIRDI